MFEIREVLRLWLRGEGLRSIERLGPVDRETEALLAQSAIDRLQSASYELVLDGESYRRRQKPGLDIGTTTARPRRRRGT